MGEVYPWKVRQMARLPGVRAEVAVTAEKLAVRARAILAAHHSPGDAAKGTSPRISVERGPVDSHVVLDDPDGGALSIEFGRAGGVDSRGRRVGPMAPIAPLRGSL